MRRNRWMFSSIFRWYLQIKVTVDEWVLYEMGVQSPYHWCVAQSVYGISNKKQVHLSVVFCKHSLNTERTKTDKMKDEDLNACEPPSPAPEAPSTSLLNGLKYSLSGEYQGSVFSGLSLLWFRTLQSWCNPESKFYMECTAAPLLQDSELR